MTDTEFSRRVEQRIEEIRADPERLMRYDRNGDGVIDDQEWEEIRKVVIAELRTEDERNQDTENHADEELEPRLVELLRERYDLVHMIGSGGQGRTYLGRAKQSGEKVAIKELDLRDAEDLKAIDLFEREGQVLKRLTHEQIPAYVEAFHVDDEQTGRERFFLVQQFVEGDSLKALIDKGRRMDQEEVVDFLEQMLSILSYLHSLSPPVIHRDIKPSNIIRRPGGAFALVDFGAVQAVLPGAGAGSTVIGTSGYMPMEQLTGEAVAATDLYALGSTVIHLASHRHPADLPMRRMRLCFEDFVNLSDGLQRFVGRLIEPHVEDRFPSAEEAQSQLARSTPVRQTSSVSPQDTSDSSAKRQVVSTEKSPGGVIIRKNARGTTIDIPGKAKAPLIMASMVLVPINGCCIMSIFHSDESDVLLFFFGLVVVSLGILVPLAINVYQKQKLSVDDRNLIYEHHPLFGRSIRRVLPLDAVRSIEVGQRLVYYQSDGERRSKTVSLLKVTGHKSVLLEVADYLPSSELNRIVQALREAVRRAESLADVCDE